MVPVHRDSTLQGLRGLAALAVVLSHLTGYWARFSQTPLSVLGLRVEDFIYFGARGVTLFFLLSGFLLVRTEGERIKRGGYSIRSYVGRRIRRIVPACYAAILLAALIWPLDYIPLRQIIEQATFIYAFDPHSLDMAQPGLIVMDHALWTLTAEAVFYLVLPLIVLKLPRLSHRLVLFGVLSLVSLGTRLYAGSISDAAHAAYLYYLPTTHLWLFAGGVVLGTILPRGFPGDRSYARWGAFFLAASLLSVAALYATGFNAAEARPTPLLMLVDGIVALFFLSALFGASLLKRILASAPLNFLGRVSYPLYLVHGIVLVALFYRLPGFASFLRGGAPAWAYLPYALLVVSLSVLAACVLHRVVERPFIGQSDSRRRLGRRAAPQSPRWSSR